jgi:hypothetical protein
MNREAGIAGLLLSVALLAAGTARPPCDGLDGPVVTAAREALAAGDVDGVLIWVQPADEAQIREAFAHTREVRMLGPEAQALADRFFFETLVRLHRAGEGAPFTGLAPAGRDLGPAIPAADRALASGEPQALEQLLVEQVRRGLHQRYARARAMRNFDPHDVASGRAYVAAYVSFIHWVEGVYEAAEREVEGHYPEPAAEPHGHP